MGEKLRLSDKACAVPCFVDAAKLRAGFELEAGGSWLKSMDAPERIPAGSCVMLEGSGLAFPVQTTVLR